MQLGLILVSVNFEGDLQSAWERDPVILLEAEVTRQLRGKNDAVN
jgi:hypothetical protein